MKPRIPQIEISFADEPFALVPLHTQDGERITKEQQAIEADNAESEKQQSNLFQLTYEKTAD